MTNFPSSTFARCKVHARWSQRVWSHFAANLSSVHTVFSSFFTTVRLARSLMFVFKLDFSSFCWAFLIFQLDTPSSSLPRAQRDGPNFTLVYGKSFLSDFSFMLFFLFLVFILCIFLVTFSTEMKSKLLIHYSYAFVVVVCLAQKSSIKIVLLLCDLINGFFFLLGDDFFSFFITRKSYITVFYKKWEQICKFFSSPSVDRHGTHYNISSYRIYS